MRVAGREVRFDRMTVAELEAVESEAGCSIADIGGLGARPTDLRAILAAVLGEGIGAARMSDVIWTDVPDDEGVAQSYVAAFGCEPWCWPPEVTRRQLVADLDAILERQRKAHQ